MYDVIVIGGGPSGLMAGVAASSGGAHVLLIDKGQQLGRKLAISGGGRCNVTNNKTIDELIRNIPGNGRFLHSALAQFNNRDIIAFFEQLGIPLKEEDHGRMFPVSDRAQTVVDALIGQIRRQGVEICIGQRVQEVLYADDHQVTGIRLVDGRIIRAAQVIVATGGCSVPRTGSTGDGYPWAQAAGHTITELYPTEVPLTSSERFIRQRLLQGLSLRDVALSIWSPKGKRLIEHEGDLLFTHFGLSGPIALRCSQFVVKALRQYAVPTVQATLDLFPSRSVQEVYDDAWQLMASEPRRTVKNVLRPLLPDRLIPLLLQYAGLDEGLVHAHIPKTNWQQLAQLIKSFPIKIDGTLPLESAFVTGGGVHLKEIDPKSMESKLTRGLYFCGEILDIHGYTGGYNITAAFSTGYTAGKNAAANVRQYQA